MAQRSCREREHEYQVSAIDVSEDILGTRTDTSDLLRRTEKKKQHHYRSLRKALREQYPTHAVKQLNFIMGIQGTTDEIGWRRNLDMPGLPATKQEKIIKRCMVASIEGMQSVLSTKWDTALWFRRRKR